MTVRLDTDFVRAQFPALDKDDWALLDNAGGSVPARPVIQRVCGYMERYGVQLGATYPRSAEAAAAVRAGHTAAAELIGAPANSVSLSSSTTLNLQLLARALRRGLTAGDEIVVTNLDHESNIGPWRELEQTLGIVIREWTFDPATLRLDLARLEPLLSPRTRLVCFTHCSNLAGAFHDVRAITDRVHAAGALVCVDGVAYAPHRKVDVQALDVDFYVVSLYKTFGPHLGLLYGKREQLLAAASQSHFFVGEDEVPYKLQPGGVSHELAAAVPGILEHLNAVDAHHHPGLGGEPATRMARAFDLIADHEARLVAPLLDYLAGRRDVHLFGPSSADRAVRAPTVAFTVAGRRSSAIPPLLERQQIAIRWGHFYAYRAARDLGLLDRDGVVRVSIGHYNTPDEIARLIAALDEALG